MEEEYISGFTFGQGDLYMAFLARFNDLKDILYSGVSGIGIVDGLVLVIRVVYTV